MKTLWWWLPLASIASVSIVGAVRRYALSHGILDHPSERSSHTVPIPLGGGLGVAAVFLSAVQALGTLGVLPAAEATAIVGSGVAALVVGFLDDQSPVHTRWRWRLLAHFVAATWALLWLGGLPPLQVIGVTLSLGWAGQIVTVVYLVWMLNLYNFMDGIDGLAGIEALTVCLSAAGLYVWRGDGGAEWLQPAVLGMVALGFLYWNWPPARIFLGDAGSGFFGLMIGVLSISGARLAQELFWAWVILIGVFVVDATFTLGRRLYRGENFYDAHRDHGYQRMARRVMAHRPVTIAVGAINVFWLLPIASLVVGGRLDGAVGVVIAYVPLVVLAIVIGSGAAWPEERKAPAAPVGS